MQTQICLDLRDILFTKAGFTPKILILGKSKPLARFRAGLHYKIWGVNNLFKCLSNDKLFLI